MPIDRAFVVAGRGTVVTGSVAHGAVQRDAELQLWPRGDSIRVRDLQAHHDQRETATGRMRLALNLAGVGVDEAGRGCELATPGYLQPSRLLDVLVATLRMPGKTIRQTLRLRLHLGTSDVLAELRLLSKPAKSTCRDEFAQLKVAEPVVATWGQRFILRDESASRTLGGGRILRPVARRWSARQPAHVDGLRILLEGPPKERLEEVIRANGWRVVDDYQVATEAGLPDAEEAGRACRSLRDRGRAQQLAAGSQRVLAHTSHLTALAEDLSRRLVAHLAANPRLPGVPRSEWPAWMPRACPQRLRAVLAEWFVAQGHVGLSDERVVPKGHEGGLSPADQSLLEEMLHEFHAGAFQPPALEALSCRTPRNEKRLRELVKLATTRGELVRVTDGMWLHGARWEELIGRVVGALRERGELTVSEIRILLDSSRKYVVPIAERLDASGVTLRKGDHRTLGPQAPPPSARPLGNAHVR